MTELTKFEINLFYKLDNLNRKWPQIDWSYRELARRWNVSIGIVFKLFQKLKIIGCLNEVVINSRRYVRSLTEKAQELIQKLKQKRTIRERYVNDSLKGKSSCYTYKKNNITITSPLPQKDETERGKDSEIEKIIARRQKDDSFPLTLVEILRSISSFGLKIYKMAANELLIERQKGYTPSSSMGWMISKMRKLKDLGI